MTDFSTLLAEATNSLTHFYLERFSDTDSLISIPTRVFTCAVLWTNTRLCDRSFNVVDPRLSTQTYIMYPDAVLSCLVGVRGVN